MIELLLGGLVEAALGHLAASVVCGLASGNGDGGADGGKCRAYRCAAPCCTADRRTAPPVPRSPAVPPQGTPSQAGGARRLFLLPSTQVRSSVPGRLRLHVAGLQGRSAWATALRRQIATLPYVESAMASEVTGNVLVCYQLTADEKVVQALVEAAAEHTDPRGQQSAGHGARATLARTATGPAIAKGQPLSS